MAGSRKLIINVSLIMLAVVFGLGQQSPMVAHGTGLGVAGGLAGVAGGLVGGASGALGGIGSLANSLVNPLVRGAPNTYSTATSGLTKPLAAALGGNPATGVSPLMNPTEPLNPQLGMRETPSADPVSMTTGILNGLATAGAAATGFGDLTNTVTNVGDSAVSAVSNLASGLGLANAARAATSPLGLVRRQAPPFGLAEGAAYRRASVAGAMASEQAVSGSESLAIDAASAAGRAGAYSGYGYGGSASSAAARVVSDVAGANAVSDIAGAVGTVGAAGAANSVGPAVTLGAAPALGAAAAAGAQLAENAVANQVASRQALASDALGNAQAEAAIAGADMVAHGANNARSASLASNAYRQAKLASARDRVNIAGTIQNSARISDAAIATHDTATKAEDSLLGSELAVDSAATVLDSDAAYIPPVTNSLLRSLPYGRLGLRNIVPKPLTYPSVLLPDVWLNGMPVNYLNVPFRMLPYGVGPTAATNPLIASGQALAAGALVHGQPFYSNNGLLINSMVFDPTLAYLNSNVNGIIGSSILPVLANGQLEAQDEIALANLVAMQQQAGPGMAATYHGYGKLNPVPLLTGSVTDNNLSPTTVIGTTYPIGSALVIEPRDSYFQDYVDNASSRQNFDERQQ